MRNRRGYTTAELVVAAAAAVLVTLAVVAQVRAWRARQAVAAMTTDLRALAVAQESYFYDHRIYAGDAAVLGPRGWHASSEVSIQVLEATTSGWSAEARHDGRGTRCYLVIRDGALVGPVTQRGVVACG